MKTSLLVTTALEETWKKEENILFLGEWCKKPHREIIWNKFDFETVAYHWNDRDKLNKDYLYSKKLYQVLINEISNCLNLYHNKDNSIRYWKIILGPWLFSFIQIALERYENLKQLLNFENNLETIVLDIDRELLTPNNVETFYRSLMSDTWNHFIYSEIIKNSDLFKRIKIKNGKFEDTENFKSYFKEKYNSKLRNAYSFCSSLLKKKIYNEKYLISESYFGLFDEIKLNLKLGCLPKFNSMEPPTEKNIDWKSREEFLFKNFNSENDLEKIIKKLIILQIPTAYFENYENICSSINKINWPSNPKIIFTSHFLQKTKQAFYTAEKIEKLDAKLIVGQHGGVYGQYKFSTIEDHELDVSDKFLSWGWQDKKNEKIIPFGIIRKLPKVNYSPKNKKILFILRCQPRYTSRINSISGSFQAYSYYKECISFCKNLDESKLLKNLLIRMHAKRFWNEEYLFKTQIPEIDIDKGYQSIFKLIKKSKLVVHSYVGTGYLETLSMNLPTLVFTNIKDCLLKKEVLDDLKALSDVNIFHESYQSAASFITKNYDNINEWWNDDITQKARIYFCKKHAIENKNKLNDIIKIFNSN